MGIACTNQQATEIDQYEGKYEALDILTPRPTEKKDVVFIWNLDIFKTLMAASCLDNKEKDILTEQVNELAVDLAETHFYFKDLQDYDMINVYDNPLTDTGQYTGQTLDDSDNMEVEDKQNYNKLTSLCRKVRDSYCDKCRQNINDLVSQQKETQWSTVRQKMDELKDKWLSDAIKSLRIINSRSSCVNILFTTNHLVQALSHVLLFELADIFRIENIYSTANIGKEICFQRIAQQFGTDSNMFVFGVSTQDEKVAEKLKMAFWKVADQSDVDSLHHALELNYL